MKHLLKLLLFLPLLSSAQTVDFSKLATKAQIDSVRLELKAANARIDSINSASGGTAKPALPDCDRGPKIEGIGSITSYGIVASFDGLNVTKIKYTVTGTNITYVDSAAPTSNKITIKFPYAFAAGNYTLYFEGLNCTGKSQRAFTIAGDVSPPVGSCEKSPTISSIQSITKTGVVVKFDAQNVTNLKLSLLSTSGSLIASNTFYPTSNTLSYSYPSQEPGNYLIKIEPLNCAGTSDSVKITIPDNSGVIEPVTPEARQGVLEYKYGTKTFGVINGKDSYVTITSDGKVKLTTPKNKQSFSGNVKLNLMVFNAMMGQMSATDIETLTTTGMDLPDGNYIFYMYWFAPKYGTDFANVKANWWDAAGNTATYRDNSGQFEMVAVDVRDSNFVNANEVKPPSDVYGATWFDDYELTNHTINVDSPKKFGITKRVEGLTPEKILTQATHLQFTYGDVNHIVSYDKTWSNLRAYQRSMIFVPYTGTLEAGATTYVDTDADVKTDDIIGIQSGQEFNTSGLSVSFKILSAGKLRVTITNTTSEEKTISGNAKCQIFDNFQHQLNQMSYITPGHIVMSEMCENGLPFAIVERLFKESASRFNLPTNQQSFVADYFAGLNGYGTDLDTKKPADIRRLFSSADSAKYNKVDGGYVSYYYQNKCYEYRNRFVNGYLTGVAELNGRSWFHIANLEKQFIAMPDVKVLVYGTNGFEGINSEMERQGAWTRLPFEKGDIIRLAQGEASFEQIKFEVLVGRILGNYHVSWHDNGLFGKYAANWNTSWYGGSADWKTQYNPKGTDQYINWNANDASQVQPDRSLGTAMFNPTIATGGNGGFAGALLYDKIADRLDKSVRWPAFSYSDNTGSHTGYYNGNEPVKGVSGSEYSRYGVSNPKQHNIANQFEYKKPIVMFCEGSAGAAAIVLDPNVGINERRTYTITEGKTYTFTHTGPAVGVYTFN